MTSTISPSRRAVLGFGAATLGTIALGGEAAFAATEDDDFTPVPMSLRRAREISRRLEEDGDDPEISDDLAISAGIVIAQAEGDASEAHAQGKGDWLKPLLKRLARWARRHAQAAWSRICWAATKAKNKVASMVSAIKNSPGRIRRFAEHIATEIFIELVVWAIQQGLGA